MSVLCRYCFFLYIWNSQSNFLLMKPKNKNILVLMLIKWGALVVDGRGKLGGHVAAQNKGGSYLRTKVTPANPNTTFQTGIRNLFGQISQAWSQLTESQIDAWNAAVDSWKQTNIFGDLKAPSGKALFQRLNTQAQRVGYPAMTVPPAKVEIPASNVTRASFDTTAKTLSFTGGYSGTAATVQLFASGPVTQGTTYVKHLLREFHNSGSTAYEPPNGYQAYENRFGTLAQGQKIFIGVKTVVASGQASPMQVVEAEITS